MKLRFIYTLFTLLLLSVLFISNKEGRAFDQGQGNTGAPGDEENSNGSAKTCQSCHNTSTQIQVTLGIEVLNDLGDPVTEYAPDQTYDVKVTLTSTGSQTPSAHGFQLVCLQAPLGQLGANEQAFSDPADNVRIAIASSNGRQYAEHKGPSEANEFMVKWTAPEVGTGTVTFYSCGNGVNLNDMSSGDNAACDQLQLTEGDPVSTKDLSDKVALSVYPNPVDNVLNLEMDSQVSGTFEMRIYNLLGQVIQIERIDLIAGANRNTFDLSELKEGSYLIQLTDGENITTRKIVKL